jgi:hypothetical protein
MSCKSCKNKTTEQKIHNTFRHDAIITKKDIKNLNENNLFKIYNKFAKEPIQECECVGVRQKITIALNHFAK